MNLKRLLKLTLIKGLSFLPKFARYPVYRQLIRVRRAPKGTIFKVADTQDEIAQALTLLHDAYVDEKLMSAEPSGMRVTTYHALPGTTTLIAKLGAQVIGTVSMIRDNPLGVPSQSLTDLQGLRRAGFQFAEISALAIKPGYRGRVLFPLLKFMHEYGTSYLGVNYFVAVVAEKWRSFYEAIMFFDKLEVRAETRTQYNYVTYNAPVALALNLKEAPFKLAKYYAWRKPGNDLFTFFFRDKGEGFKFPAREFSRATDPVMTPQMLDFFFRQKSELFNELDAKSIRILHQLYPEPDYKSVLPDLGNLIELNGPRSRNLRDKRRVHVQCHAEVELSNGVRVPFSVINASPNGFCAIFEDSLNETEINGSISIGKFHTVRFKARTVWCRDNRVYGYHLCQVEGSWDDFLRYSENSASIPSLRRSARAAQRGLKVSS
jgi:hypothetical protein